MMYSKVTGIKKMEEMTTDVLQCQGQASIKKCGKYTAQKEHIEEIKLTTNHAFHVNMKCNEAETSPVNQASWTVQNFPMFFSTHVWMAVSGAQSSTSSPKDHGSWSTLPVSV